MKVIFYTTFFILLCTYSVAYSQGASTNTSSISLEKDSVKVNELLALSKYNVYSNPLKMNQQADQALLLSQDINYERGVAMSLCLIGQAKLQLADYNEALSFLLSALEISERLKYEECIGLSFKLLGHIYLYQNDLDKAKEHYEKSLAIAKKIKNNELLIGVQNGMGNIYAARRDYQQALDTYFSSLSLSEKENNQTKIADIESNIGRVYLAQGMSSLAIEFFQKALETAKNTNNIEEIADNSLILASYYSNRGVSSAALSYAQMSLAAAEKIQSKFFIQKSWLLLSEIYGQRKEYKKAYEYNQLSKTLQDSILGKDNVQQYSAITSQYEKDAKDKEMIIKNMQIEQQKKDTQNQRNITYIFVASSVIFIGLSILAFVLYRRQRTVNKLMEEQNRQIKEQNDEINTKSKEINIQKTNLESKGAALEGAYNEIEKKNDSIMASISYAKRIQVALLPSKEEFNATFPQSFIYYKPKDVISGDFYYCATIPASLNGEGEKKIIAVADCTGHGVPGAFMSVLGVQSLNKIIQAGIISPDKVLSLLHMEIRDVLKQQVNEVRDGMDIVLCVIDKKQKTLTYSGAINPLYYVQNNDAGKPEFVEIKATKRPIGGFQREEGERYFEKHVIDISKPTTFYLSTDGYRDQFGGENNKKFMARRFKELLFHIQDKPIQAQQQILHEVIKNWLGKNNQIDDMLVIGIRT